MKHSLTQAQLKELLTYNPDTGVFHWVTPTPRRLLKGCVAGNLPLFNGYSYIGIYGFVYKAHRLAWLYVHGTWPERVVDHINGLKGDNRIANLRDVAQSENMRNSSNCKDSPDYKSTWATRHA